MEKNNWMRTLHSTVSIFALMALLLTLLFVFILPRPAYAALPNKTLLYCSEASPRSFDPSQAGASVEYTAGAFTVHNRLVEFDRDVMKIGPGLATHWEISPDGLRYTFYLRRAVKFHTTSFFKPTRDFNADDVLFTFGRMHDPQHPFRKAYPVPFPYFTNLGLDKEIVEIKKLDDYTVRFTLKSVNAPFLMNLGLGFASILSAEYGEKLLKMGKAADINQRPVGTGPFIFNDYTKDVSIRFDGNPNYWKPEDVQVSKLVFLITPDPALRLQKLKKKECHVINHPNLDDLDAIKSEPNLKLFSRPALILHYLAYNMSHKPFDDIRVRQALDMAINKESINQIAFRGTGKVAEIPIPSVFWRQDGPHANRSYNLQEAKKLLAQAGYPNGLKLSLWVNPLHKSTEVAAEMIQADWRKMGVEASIRLYEWGEYLRRARAGEHDVALTSWTGSPDLDDWLGVLLTCGERNNNNYAQWCNPSFDGYIQKARETINPTEREIFYKEALQIFIREQPFTPLTHVAVYQATRKEVTNFKVNYLTAVLFTGVGLE
ncbi:Extracellular solute-binding protein family 5 [Mycoavidus cysteinexigens]|uniref:Extracellular solute-binding protein family 5 n=1 Tax=Mycoavidus cysteinexigens TaxID=1553431 RepID=A0A2Z6EWJ0_9BURK|nr:ABC transporter substrate-binding protein [Mycoavidus cysteinexigens]BBE09844.1 Extracellular solute-binding protein family 5 [Mycoavidus cysteinexigens]GAM53809.1 dipeptide-binding ABC transporter, periplasmic substrate-binding component [bacterium endosymbiont of Mortierella elongata FMR23-6]GLR02292.1 periplasmic dipeptide transporter [Mycoavidus cysteinexigens]